MTEVIEVGRRVRSMMKQHTFKNGDVKIKGWLKLEDLQLIVDDQGRCFIEILPLSEPNGKSTHFVRENTYKPDSAKQ